MYISKMTTLRIHIISLLVGVTFLGAVCSRNIHHNPSLEIIGGKQIDENEANYTVFLWPYKDDPVTYKKSYIRCGGSKLSDEYVLTAKHCLSGRAGTYLRFGSHDTKKKSKAFLRIDTTSSFILHNTADIAIIKVSPPVNTTTMLENVTQPLKKNALNLYENETGTAYGWGLLDNGTLARYLMGVNVTVISKSQCDAELALFNHPATHDYELCTSGNSASDPKGTCGGDSGGPFMIDNVQVGIVARGPDNCTAGGPSVYVRTGHFLDWIEQETGIILP